MRTGAVRLIVIVTSPSHRSPPLDGLKRGPVLPFTGKIGRSADHISEKSGQTKELRRLPDDQLGRQHVGVLYVLAVQQSQQLPGEATTDLQDRLPDRGQRRVGERGHGV